MRGGRGGLAVAACILLALAALCVVLAAGPLADTGRTLPRAWALLRALPGPDAGVAVTARHAIEGAAAVAAICAVLSVPLGWALWRLPRFWSALARALLCYPALLLILAWALGGLLLLPQQGVVQAGLGAAARLDVAAGRRACLVLLLLPPLAGAVAAAWRRIDPAALRAAQTLGLGPARTFRRLALPELLEPLVEGTAVAFLVAAAALAVRPQAVAVPPDPPAIAALAAVLAAGLALLLLLARVLAQPEA